MSQLAGVLQGWGDKVVPIIGAGLNAQVGISSSWLDLLQDVAASLKLSLSAKPQEPFTHYWENMVLEYARITKKSPHIAENKMLKRLQTKVLQQKSRKCVEFLFNSSDAEEGLKSCYQNKSLPQILLDETQNTDIVSLNFNLLLVEHISKLKLNPMPIRTKSGGYSLRSRTKLRFEPSVNGIKKRVWHPHGFANRYKTMMLGVRRYGDSLDEVEQAWRSGYLSSIQSTNRDSYPQTWVDLFIHRPLIFIGCSLGFEEYDLWWMLQQRARYWNNPIRGKKPPTLILLAEDNRPCARLQNVHFCESGFQGGKFANVQPIYYSGSDTNSSYDQMWQDLFWNVLKSES